MSAFNLHYYKYSLRLLVAAEACHNAYATKLWIQDMLGIDLRKVYVSDAQGIRCVAVTLQ